MKIYNVESPEKFLEVIQQCKGSVELISKQGDRLNLKSELTKYLAVSKLFADTALINDIELVASDPDDVKFLLDYMMQGK
ncbi:MAG: polya polymerase [Lachnospiraceae bacterium]|nr:polya polymerase [Lachnospiraceae bacterium]